MEELRVGRAFDGRDFSPRFARLILARSVTRRVGDEL